MKATVKILRNDRNIPQGKLADAELHFTGGELDGLKLIGFAVWQRRDGVGRNVTFPARQFTVHGEKRSFRAPARDRGSERAGPGSRARAAGVCGVGTGRE